MSLWETIDRAIDCRAIEIDEETRYFMEAAENVQYWLDKPLEEVVAMLADMKEMEKRGHNYYTRITSRHAFAYAIAKGTERIPELEGFLTDSYYDECYCNFFGIGLEDLLWYYDEIKDMTPDRVFATRDPEKVREYVKAVWLPKIKAENADRTPDDENTT